MQDKIRSEYTDWELLKESEENQVYRCFELVGIYKLYNELYWNENNFEYSCAAEPPVRCGESHQSGL